MVLTLQVLGQFPRIAHMEQTAGISRAILQLPIHGDHQAAILQDNRGIK
jgi:hypothetical protein